MTTEDYKRISYKKLQDVLHKEFSDSTLTETGLAVKLSVRSTQTVRNLFNIEGQMVSDELLSKLTKILGIDSKIEWVGGVRYYSIKN